jgi:hypothetical protein
MRSFALALNWFYLAILAALIVAGLALCRVWLRGAIRRVVADYRLQADHRTDTLSAAVKLLQAQVSELREARDLQPPMASEFDLEAAASVIEDPSEAEEEEVTAEIMAVIAAAATAFLGKKVRILSARLLQSPTESVSAWSQQGRAFVQASHNLRSRG